MTMLLRENHDEFGVVTPTTEAHKENVRWNVSQFYRAVGKSSFHPLHLAGDSYLLQ